ncbi:hypothetical protein, partial [Pontiella desulfatans]|uniref:hypothetical protein n=1 Tax=Pontiella desulfatans TaxID=2750659 RepID=UPI00109C9737
MGKKNEKQSGNQYSKQTTTGEEKMRKIEEVGSENNCETTLESLGGFEVLARYYAVLDGVGILTNEELKTRILGYLARPLMEEEVTRGERMGQNAVCPQSWSLERTFKLASFQESEYKCYVEHLVDEVEISSAMDIVALNPDFRTTGLSGTCVLNMVQKDAWKWEENEE